MGRRGGRRHRGGAAGPEEEPPGELKVELRAGDAFFRNADINDCPAAVAFAEDLNDDHRSVTLILPAWQLVNGLLEWFSRGASQDGSARLRFPPSLGKPHRAHIHQVIDRSYPGELASLSEGVGSERHLCVLQAAAASASEQAAPRWDDATAAKGKALFRLARDAGLQVSRDEVCERLARGQLTPELQALWEENAEEQVEMHELCTAAAAGDVDALNRLLQRLPPQATAYAPGHRIDLATGSLPLHEAAREGHRACIEALAAAGADLNALDARGRTALQVARQHEQCDCEAALLQCGARDTQPPARSWIETRALPALGDAASATAAPGPSQNAVSKKSSLNGGAAARNAGAAGKAKPAAPPAGKHSSSWLDSQGQLSTGSIVLASLAAVGAVAVGIMLLRRRS